MLCVSVLAVILSVILRLVIGGLLVTSFYDLPLAIHYVEVTSILCTFYSDTV